jgi:hypothetical protein
MFRGDEAKEVLVTKKKSTNSFSLADMMTNHGAAMAKYKRKPVRGFMRLTKEIFLSMRRKMRIAPHRRTGATGPFVSVAIAIAP